MKIISWNVNGFRSVMRKGALEDVIVKYDPDLVFVQELKCADYQLLDAVGQYSSYINDNYVCYVDGSEKAGKYGVALLAKESIALDEHGNSKIFQCDPERIDPKFDGWRESRLQAFVIDGILMLNSYSVRVTSEMVGFRRSQQYNQHLLNILDLWKAEGNTKALIIGDINITPYPLDQHELKMTVPMLSMTDEEREKYLIMFTHPDLHDTFRVLHPKAVKFSYWSYKYFSRERGKGYRLDYALVTTDLLKDVEEADILTFEMGSDHAPIWLKLREE